MKFKELVEKDLHIKLTDDMLNKFNIYYEFLVEKNKVMNLTSITNKEDVYLKHFYDSLTLVKVVKIDNQVICDVGSGAGFPSIPIKICFPGCKVVIVDSLKKRINFLGELVDKLGIDNITLIHGRAEDYVKSVRETFDIVTARAVAKLNILMELCSAYVKLGGLFIAMKGLNGQKELLDSQNCASLLGMNHDDTCEFSLPNENSKRYIYSFKKNKLTNKNYPRMYKNIIVKPL